MTDLRQAAQQALEALEGLADYRYTDRVKNTMASLRQALAEPEQEPVAWVEPKWLDPDTRGWPSDSFESVPIEGWLPLYTASTPQSKPQTTHWEGCEAVHPECRKPEQEPVATKQMLRWVEHLKRLSDDGQHMSIPGLSSGACWELAIELEQFIKNTAPIPRKPLTDEEIRGLADKHLFYQPEGYEVSGIFNFARAIERAHGIGEQHE